MNLNRDQKTIIVVLSLINFLNYVDRQVVFPLFGSIKREFLISDFSLGLLGTMFMLVHSLASLPLGVLADKMDRRKVISVGIIFWSAMTFLSGLSQNFKQLLAARSLVGIGEASYAPAATAMISDNVPKNFWARAQGLFNAAMFVGGTLGAMLGGVIAFYFNHNWRLAFFLVSVPGFLLAFLALRLKDTGSGKPHLPLNFKLLLKNKAYIWVLISGSLVTFSAGAFITWGVEFVSRYKGYNLRDASIILGSTLMLAGVAGVILGSVISDWLHAKYVWGRAVVIAVSISLAAPFMYLGLQGSSGFLFFFYFFLGTLLLSVYHSPVTATIHDLVPENARATAFAAYILVIHLLGDTLAPAIVGIISDMSDLKTGLEWSSLIVLLGGLSFGVVVWLIGKNKIPLYEGGKTEPVI
ncbi:MAG: MFS transporter [Candidatus Doudnabacteria bacterium]|nr:MFS transporter [Candidatus Doudnabacteria bacterium]